VKTRASGVVVVSEQARQWKVRDALFSPWRELPGRHTATEIWERRASGEFKVAVPVLEDTSHQTVFEQQYARP
jgi:hypothetical protein